MHTYVNIDIGPFKIEDNSKLVARKTKRSNTSNFSVQELNIDGDFNEIVQQAIRK